MTNKRVEPSISLVSFSCPHCGALADQLWYDIYAVKIDDHCTPFRPDEKLLEIMRKEEDDDRIPAQMRESHIRYVERALSGEVFFEPSKKSLYGEPEVTNLSISRCFSCKALSAWVYDRVVHPPLRTRGKRGRGQEGSGLAVMHFVSVRCCQANTPALQARRPNRIIRTRH